MSTEVTNTSEYVGKVLLDTASCYLPSYLVTIIIFKNHWGASRDDVVRVFLAISTTLYNDNYWGVVIFRWVLIPEHSWLVGLAWLSVSIL